MADDAAPRSTVRAPRAITYVLGIVAALALTVVLVVMVMRPPPGDLLALALLFAATAAASAFIGFVSHRAGWWRRFHSLRQTLTLGYVIAAGLTLLNVWLTAKLMFINRHDLALAGLLLLFAGGISISFGYFLSASITHTLADLVRAAGRLSRGDFAARVPVAGEDEVAQLGRAFNAMAARLQQADADQRALEAARRDLVAWASHDLRTPLASLRAMVDALADGVVADPASVARYLQQSQAEIGRMSALIDDLFELAQMDAGNLVLHCETSSLADLISDTLEAFSARAGARGIALSGQVEPGTDPVWMAPDKIGRVLRNLVENALRHTPPGGAIELHALPQAGGVVVTVRDTGEGIAPEDLGRVFDRFYRGDAARARALADTGAGAISGGAGLGLAIARGLVEAHGGTISAESATGRGTTMRFTLPNRA
jgi:signal transduction histidine kinase